MKCLYAASEVAGFAKTGGLADVAGSLPRALTHRGWQCSVIAPLYRCVRQGSQPLTPTGLHFTVQVGDRPVAGALWRSTLPASDVPVYFVEQPGYFERDDPAQGRGLYHFTMADGSKRDYPDNCERFVFFSRAVLEAVRLLDAWPDVLHLNDWQTGLVPAYLRELYGKQAAGSGERYQAIKTLFTIHNMAHQGVFWHWDLHLTGLPWRLFNFEQLEFHGHINLLKAGLVFSDLITTVSPTYAREIQTPFFGCGLQGVLAQRRDRLHGIVNGADYGVWDPATDRHLAANYDAGSVVQGKAVCKQALQKRCGLPERPDAPLLGMVSRLAEQKGLNLLGEIAPALLRQDLQVVVLGEGDAAYRDLLRGLQARFPAQLRVVFALDEALAHQIEAGADVFLMPSLYEPCGLNQLYSLKYGTVPVVRATGGLADTVVNTTAETLAAGTATGFVFVPPVADLFLATVERALSLHWHEPEKWLAVVRNGMRQDWSWNKSAGEYEKLYQSLQAQ